MSRDLIQMLKEREYEAYLVDNYNAHMEHYSDWKDRINKADALIRGDWEMVWGSNQKTQVEKPMVQNLGEVMARDVPRLVADTEPSLRAAAHKDDKAGGESQYLRQAIAATHWIANEGDLLVPLWAIDLIVTGAAFSVTWTDESSEYPKFERIDPRFCYPDVFNGKIQELMVVQKVKQRIAARVAGGIDIPNIKGDEEIQIMDYYSPEYIVHAVLVVKGGKASGDKIWMTEAQECKQLTADMVQLPSHDGAFRGLIDQYGDSMEAKNRLAKLMVQYAEQQVTAPIVEKGVLNANRKPGPNTIYHLDPGVADAQMGRLQPAGGSPQLFALIQLLDTEQRGGIGYPASRQGEVDQSVATGAFVASTQGQLTSIVREAMRYIAKLRSDMIATAFNLEEQEKNFEKPLLVGMISGKNSYVPETDISGRNIIRVMYGASAGLDRLQADVRLLQLYSAGIITAETARENLEFVDDPETEADKWEKEQSRKAVLQRFLTDPNTPFDLVLETLMSQESGKGLPEALEEARKKMQEKAAADQAQQQQEPQAGPMGTPPTATMEEDAALKGETPPEPQPGQPVEFNPPPLQQVLVQGR